MLSTSNNSLDISNAKFSPISDGEGLGGGSENMSDRIANFKELPNFEGRTLLKLKLVEPLKVREITQSEEATGGYKYEKYGKIYTGRQESHLVLQRPNYNQGEISGWSDASPITKDEFNQKYESHPTLSGTFKVKADKFTLVLLPNEGEVIRFNNANENFNDEVKYGDGKSLAFDGKGVPYIFPFIQHVHDNKTYERCGEMSGKDFAANLK